MAAGMDNKRDQADAGIAQSGNLPQAKLSKDDIGDLPPLEGQFALLMMHIDKKVDKKIDRIEEKIDSTKSQVDDLSHRVASLELERQKFIKGASGTHTAHRGNSGHSQANAPSRAKAGGSIESEEWKALIVGFEEDTQGDHIDIALKKLEEIMKAACVTNRHARGGRSTQGIIKFEDKESLTSFVKETKKKGPVKVICNEKEVLLEAKVFRTKEEKAETKEIRTFAYIMRQQMGFTGQDRNILDISFQHQAVLVNNVRVAQFLDDKGLKIKGNINKEIHTFKIDDSKLAAQAQSAGFPVDPKEVNTAYLAAMRQ
jgi:hypothetical protein